MGQTWSPTSAGGYLANNTLSRKIRYAAQSMQKFRQFNRPEPGYGKHKGESILFDRISDVVIGGRSFSELASLPEDSFSISQGSVTVDLIGNSIPYSFKLEQLAEFDIDNIIQKTLRNDIAKQLDEEDGIEMRTAPVKAVPTGTPAAPSVTFETTLATTATRHVQGFDVKDIVDSMKSTYRTPKYDMENFMCVGSIGFNRKIFDDADFHDDTKYGDPTRLFSGEVKRWYGVRFVEESNILSNTLGGTSYKGEAIFFGDDPIIEGVALPEELRVKRGEEAYGMTKGIGWVYLGGRSLTYDSSTAGELKVIRLYSV